MPTASIEAIRARAEMLKRIRDFFAERQVLEVETPLLGRTACSHPDLPAVQAHWNDVDSGERRSFFLQTSPESAMKRLLARGSGPIYQICKAFRAEGADRTHNPEFTILEWYRPGFGLEDLIDEVEAILRLILSCGPASRVSFSGLFQTTFDIDPRFCHSSDLARIGTEHGLVLPPCAPEGERDRWLELLMARCIEPRLGLDAPCVVYDYPASLACMARVRTDDPHSAERFEIFANGIELANGYKELTDAGELRHRFEVELQSLVNLGLDCPPLDEHLLAAISHGMPECAGVALGLDRLLMLRNGSTNIAEIIAFPIERA